MLASLLLLANPAVAGPVLCVFTAAEVLAIFCCWVPSFPGARSVASVLVVGDVSVVDGALIVHGVPTVANIPIVDDVPVVDGAIIVHGVPTVDNVPVVDDVPVVDGALVVHGVPTVASIPVVDDVPTIASIPVVDGVPTVTDCRTSKISVVIFFCFCKV